jgi:hypothetical protein
MSYAEEISQESNIPRYVYIRPEYAEFDYSGKDKHLSTLVENSRLTGEELADAVNRLAQIAAVNGDVRARVSLARFGGIDIHRGNFFRLVVDNPVDKQFDYSAHLELLRMARAKRDTGDYLRYLALSATVGIYPPEYGDTIVDPADIELNPYYDTKNDMRIGPDTCLIGVAGNGG